MIPFTKSSLADLKSNVAFRALLDILERDYAQKEDTWLIDPDPFTHGKGVGAIYAYKTIFNLINSGLADIADNKKLEKLR